MDTCSAIVGKLDAGTMEAVKNAFSQLLGNSEFSLPTPRIVHAKECVRYLQTREYDIRIVEFADAL